MLVARIEVLELGNRCFSNVKDVPRTFIFGVVLIDGMTAQFNMGPLQGGLLFNKLYFHILPPLFEPTVVVRLQSPRELVNVEFEGKHALRVGRGDFGQVGVGGIGWSCFCLFIGFALNCHAEGSVFLRVLELLDWLVREGALQGIGLVGIADDLA